jgi:acetoin utilization deacetylase AcuC-like enzyme
VGRRLFYSDHYQIPLPEGHKFPIRKYRLLRDLLTADGFYHFEPTPLADPKTIMLAHDASYVQQFLEGSLPPASMRRIGFPWSEGLVQRTLASVGGTLASAADALEYGFGGTLSGGTHHAFRGEGAGFCVFNDVAVAIYWLRLHRGVQRAAVVDLDVHQGDGTAHFFEHDPDVFTLSLHGAHNFPFRKQRSKLDVELPDRTGDEDYMAALDRALPQVFEFDPQIVFYLSGVDALASDVLGRLALTADGLKNRDRRVIEACHRQAIPLVITLGGGYSDPIELTAQAHANTFRVAMQVFGGVSEAGIEPLRASNR